MQEPTDAQKTRILLMLRSWGITNVNLIDFKEAERMLVNIYGKSINWDKVITIGETFMKLEDSLHQIDSKMEWTTEENAAIEALSQITALKLIGSTKPSEVIWEAIKFAYMLGGRT